MAFWDMAMIAAFAVVIAAGTIVKGITKRKLRDIDGMKGVHTSDQNIVSKF